MERPLCVDGQACHPDGKEIGGEMGEKDNEVIGKLTTENPEKEPYVSPLLGDKHGPAVFYEDVEVWDGQAHPAP